MYSSVRQLLGDARQVHEAISRTIQELTSSIFLERELRPRVLTPLSNFRVGVRPRVAAKAPEYAYDAVAGELRSRPQCRSTACKIVYDRE
jgi:hypothetical protein